MGWVLNFHICHGLGGGGGLRIMEEASIGLCRLANRNGTRENTLSAGGNRLSALQGPSLCSPQYAAPPH